jgi:hypothetical protein
MASPDEQIYEKYSEELIRFATFLVGPVGAPSRLLFITPTPARTEHREA